MLITSGSNNSKLNVLQPCTVTEVAAADVIV
jgi:hypothetical protein